MRISFFGRKEIGGWEGEKRREIGGLGGREEKNVGEEKKEKKEGRVVLFFH